MEDKPLVSVLMTSYNREKYIAEAIESVLASSYTNFELIIVDDCSKDNTAEIARSYESKDTRVKLYVNETNLGDYPNRNVAASYANGKYLKYVDSDDMIYPNSLELMVNALEKNKNSALAISSRYNNVPSNNYIVFNPKESYETHFFKRGLLDNGPTALIIKNEVFKEFGGFSGKRNVSDFELWLKIAARYPIIEMQSNMVFWRIHPGQEIQLANEVYLEYNLLIYTNALNSSECPLTEIQKNEILKGLKKNTYWGIIKYCLKKNKVFNILRLLRINKLKLIDAF
jgi:glycosyltransferase involved in cell wall biosynthesis